MIGCLLEWTVFSRDRCIFLFQACCLVVSLVAADVASSLQDPKYKIDFHPTESPVLPVRSVFNFCVCFQSSARFFLVFMLESDISFYFTHSIIKRSELFFLSLLRLSAMA